jgi:hypothetical protein
MDNHYYKLTASHVPAKDEDGIVLREFSAIKLTGPFVGDEPAEDATQYGVWWTPDESRPTIERRISDMVFAVVKEFKEEGDEGIA